MVLIAGNENFLSKFQKAFPKIKCISNKSFDRSLIRNADIILFQCKHLAHDIFDTAINQCRIHQKRFEYLSYDNVSKCKDIIVKLDNDDDKEKNNVNNNEYFLNKKTVVFVSNSDFEFELNLKKSFKNIKVYKFYSLKSLSANISFKIDVIWIHPNKLGNKDIAYINHNAKINNVELKYFDKNDTLEECIKKIIDNDNIPVSNEPNPILGLNGLPPLMLSAKEDEIRSKEVLTNYIVSTSLKKDVKMSNIIEKPVAEITVADKNGKLFSICKSNIENIETDESTNIKEEEKDIIKETTAMEQKAIIETNNEIKNTKATDPKEMMEIIELFSKIIKLNDNTSAVISEFEKNKITINYLNEFKDNLNKIIDNTKLYLNNYISSNIYVKWLSTISDLNEIMISGIIANDAIFMQKISKIINKLINWDTSKVLNIDNNSYLANQKFKSICDLIGITFQSPIDDNKNTSIYKQFYSDRKKYYSSENIEKDEQDKLNVQMIRETAKRETIKLFLSHLFEVMYLIRNGKSNDELFKKLHDSNKNYIAIPNYDIVKNIVNERITDNFYKKYGTDENENENNVPIKNEGMSKLEKFIIYVSDKSNKYLNESNDLSLSESRREKKKKLASDMTDIYCELTDDKMTLDEARLEYPEIYAAFEIYLSEN